jgi:imidazolonepropionase-like amidohydrolase
LHLPTDDPHASRLGLGIVPGLVRIGRALVVGLLLGAGLLLAATRAVAEEAPLVLRDVTILPLSDQPARPGQSILIRGDRIEQVGPDAEVEAPRGARVVAGAGRFAIPGLTDAHVHVKRSNADLDRLLPLFLAHGVTTVVNLDGGPTVLRLREEVRSGVRTGPAIYTSGPILRGSEGMTRDQGDQIASEQIAAGYDFLKVYNAIPEEAYRAIVERASAAGVPVIGHAVRSVGIAGALESGQHIAHMEEVVYGHFTWDRRPDRPAELPEDVVARLDRLLDPASIPDLARRFAAAGVFVIPNLVAYHNIERQLVDLDGMLARPEVAWMPASMTRSWQRDRNGYMNREDPERFRRGVQRTFPFLQQLTAAFQQAGVPLLAGTDVGIPVIVAGSSLHDELVELVEAGLRPHQALAAATTSAARFLGRDDAGHLAAGGVADLVLLRENPLDDIRSVRTVDAVVVRGRLFERVDLDGFLAGAPAGR